jgi:hypothetical protein
MKDGSPVSEQPPSNGLAIKGAAEAKSAGEDAQAEADPSTPPEPARERHEHTTGDLNGPRYFQYWPKSS